MPHSPRRRVAVALAAAGALLACRTGRGRSYEPASAAIQVENHGFADARVYVLHLGERLRLGLATGHATTVLPIPGRMLVGSARLRFLIVPIAGPPEPPSDEITAFPGDTIVLVIEGP